MQRIITSLPIIVLGVAVGLLGYYLAEKRMTTNKTETLAVTAEKVSADNLPVSETLPEKDRLLVSDLLHSPEKLDEAPVVAQPDAVCPPQHPPLMSEIAPPETTNTPLSPEWTPAFQKDFESLRTEAFRNPDSEMNRATVRSLMEKRQQRLARDGR